MDVVAGTATPGCGEGGRDFSPGGLDLTGIGIEAPGWADEDNVVCSSCGSRAGTANEGSTGETEGFEGKGEGMEATGDGRGVDGGRTVGGCRSVGGGNGVGEGVVESESG